MEDGKYNRDINCLKDREKSTRLSGLTRLTASAKSEPNLLGLFTLIKFPLLDLLKDPADKCKELSVSLLHFFISTSSVPPEDISLIIQSFHSRIGQESQQESCEEVRISLLNTLLLTIHLYSPFIHLELTRVTDIVSRATKDKFPAAKLLGGEMIDALVERCSKVSAYARKLVQALRANLFHQQFKVRINALEALGKLIRLSDAQNLIAEVFVDLKKMQLDRKPEVVECLNSVICAVFKALEPEVRSSCEGKLVYLLLCSFARSKEVLEEVAEGRIGEHHGARLIVLSYFDEVISMCLSDLQEWTLQDNFRTRGGNALLQIIEVCGEHMLTHIELILPVIFKAFTYDQAEYLSKAVQSIGLCCDFTLLVSLFTRYCMGVNSLLDIVSALKLLEKMIQILPQDRIDYDPVLHLLSKLVETEEISVLRQVHSLVNLLLQKFQSRINAAKVFYIVLGLDSSAISSEVQETISALAVYGGITVEELYQQNLETCLPELIKKYKRWTKDSIEVALFTKLVCRTLQLNEQVLEVVTFNCQSHVDERVRRAMLEVVRNCVRDQKYSQLVIDQVIVPTASWNDSCTLRVQSIELLLWLLEQMFIDPVCFKHNWGKLVPLLKTCASDEFSGLRTAALNVFAVIVNKCFSSVENIDLWDLYTELLKRLDDSLDSVRVLSCKIFCEFFDGIHDKGLKLGNFRYVVESLFTNLDDPSEEIQKWVAEALRRVIKLDRVEFVEIAKEAEKRHRHPRAVGELIVAAQGKD